MKKIIISELNKDLLNEGTHKVIDCLSQYPLEYKLGILHILIESFPAEYIIQEKSSDSK